MKANSTWTELSNTVDLNHRSLKAAALSMNISGHEL